MRARSIRALGIFLNPTLKRTKNFMLYNPVSLENHDWLRRDTIMAKVKVPLNPHWSSKIPEIRRALPEELRVCSECGEEVIIHEHDLQTAPTDAPPFEAELIGCNHTVNKVIEFVERTFHDK